jgi:hypothetical protein
MIRNFQDMFRRFGSAYYVPMKVKVPHIMITDVWHYMLKDCYFAKTNFLT